MEKVRSAFRKIVGLRIRTRWHVAYTYFLPGTEVVGSCIITIKGFLRTVDAYNSAISFVSQEFCDGHHNTVITSMTRLATYLG